MKKQFLDYFKKSYKAKFSVEIRDVIPLSDEQLRGFDFFGTPLTDEMTEFLQEWRPGILRVGPETDLTFFSSLCRDLQCSPHFVFSALMPEEELKNRLDESISRFSGEEGFWEPKRFYELSLSKSEIPFDDETALGTLIEKLHALSRLIREKDPAGKIILPGITPFGSDYGRSERWNIPLMECCRADMDLIGIAWHHPDPQGWTWDEAADGMEAACVCAENFSAMLKRLAGQIDAAAPDSEIRAAVTSWGFRKNSGALTKQDMFFYASVYRQIRSHSRLAAVCEAGPVFGAEGLTEKDEYGVYTTALGEFFKLMHNEMPVALKVSPMTEDEKIPVTEWPGVPGQIDSMAVPLTEVYASRSADGKRIYLLAVNRNPYKRAEIRLRYYNFGDMRPVEARVLRSKKPLDRNDAETPEAVTAKDISLRKYRTMDHVNLDLPECGIVSMLLMGED